MEQFITFASQPHNAKSDARVRFHVAIGATIDMNTNRSIFGLLFVAVVLQADVTELHALTWSNLAAH